MFFQRMSLDAPPDALRALHPSLNTPVVGLEDEVAGPARAALAVLQGDDGRARVVVAIRLLAKESAATFAPDDVSATSESLGLLIESALSFAESMGFLLDDDLLAEAGPRDAAIRQRARAHWCELLGSTFVEPEKPELDGVAPLSTRSSPLTGRDADSPTAIFPAPGGEPARRAVPLSKFRVSVPPRSAEAVPTMPAPDPSITTEPEPGGDRELEIALPAPDAGAVSIAESDAVTPPPTGATKLGRVRLLRRRAGNGDLPRPGWLQRLLSAF